MFIIIFAILGSLIGVTTRIDTLQFQEIESLNDRLHELDKLVAVSNERIEILSTLEEERNRPG